MIDPAFDMPFNDYQQVGSFIAPVAPPTLGPLDGTLVSLPCINPDWLRILLGCVDQLRNPSAWKGLTDSATLAVLYQVEQLRGALQVANPCCNVAMRLQGCVLQFSTDGGSTWTDVTNWSADFDGCVKASIPPPVPPNPGGITQPQFACNMAGFLANAIIKKALSEAVTAFNANLTQLQYAEQVMSEIAWAFPITYAAVTALYDFYAYYTSITIAAFTFAESDGALWGEITCAIYRAITPSGYVTPGNYSALVSGICGLGYLYPAVINAICAFVSNIGVSNLQAMQAVGALDDVDCTDCGTWCRLFDFTTGTQGWVIGPPPFNVGFHDASGWHGSYDAGNNVTNMVIVLSLGGTYVIDDVCLWVTAPTANAHFAGDRHVNLVLSGSSVNNQAFPDIAYPSEVVLCANHGGVLADTIAVQWIDDGSTNFTIRQIKVFGSGTVLPLGVTCP